MFPACCLPLWGREGVTLISFQKEWRATGFPMKNIVFRYNAGIVTNPSISYDDYRRPRWGAPAADGRIKIVKNSLPALPRRGPEAGVLRIK